MIVIDPGIASGVLLCLVLGYFTLRHILGFFRVDGSIGWICFLPFVPILISGIGFVFWELGMALLIERGAPLKGGLVVPRWPSNHYPGKGPRRRVIHEPMPWEKGPCT